MISPFDLGALVGSLEVRDVNTQEAVRRFHQIPCLHMVDMAVMNVPTGMVSTTDGVPPTTLRP